MAEPRSRSTAPRSSRCCRSRSRSASSTRSSRSTTTTSSSRYTFRPEADFYRGHFPGNPITPGVLLIEAMAQTGVVALGIYLVARDRGVEDVRRVLTVFTDCTAEFSGVVRPGDTVTIRARKVFFRRMKLRAEVEMRLADGTLVATATVAGMGSRGRAAGRGRREEGHDAPSRRRHRDGRRRAERHRPRRLRRRAARGPLRHPPRAEARRARLRLHRSPASRRAPTRSPRRTSTPTCCWR